MSRSKLLGILGGLGPMSTAYFYEMLIAHTKVSCDQDHIDVVISGRATTPDRTSYLVGASGENPLDTMCADAHRLENFGAEIIAIPCNTAHYFYEQIQDSIHVPLLNIIYETVHFIRDTGARCAGILATDGTIRTHTYQHMCERLGLAYMVPEEDDQAAIMEIIYGAIKSGAPVDLERFLDIAERLFARGCDRMILGCTELSLIKKAHGLDTRFVDSLEILACKSIYACGKEPIGFPDTFAQIGTEHAAL